MTRRVTGWLGAAARHVFMDLSPLRRSADFRAFIGGQLVSTLGNQLTAVAVPYQVYRLTHSSLYVGLVSLTQLFPLIGASLLGGSLVDAVDRRRLLLVTQLLMAACSAGLAVNADLSSALWPLFVCPALTAGLGGVDSAARNAMVPGMVGLRDVPAANAMFQALFQLGAVAGPAAAGLLLAGAGIRVVYWVDVASFGASLLAVFLMSPQPPGGAARRPGLRSIAEGFRFVRGHQAVQGAYLIDLNAMVFGLPRALFPALAATVFGGGASTVGLLYAAPGAGALLGALTTGWVGRIRRQGLAVIAAVIVWGLAITGFGLVKWLPAALALLAVAGWADVISAVFRNTIIQLSVPDALRGRLMGVQMAVVAGGPRLGDLEAGAAATAFGDTVAVVSGGLACVAGAVSLARLLPGFRRHRTRYAVPGAVPSEPIDEPADVSGSEPVPDVPANVLGSEPGDVPTNVLGSEPANVPADVPGVKPVPESRGLPLVDAGFCGGFLASCERSEVDPALRRCERPPVCWDMTVMCTRTALDDLEEKSPAERKGPLSGTFSSTRLLSSTQWSGHLPAMR